MTDRDVEMKIVAHIINNEDDFLYLESQGISADFFAHEEGGVKIYRKIYVNLGQYYSRYGRLLTQEALELRSLERGKKETAADRQVISAFMQCRSIPLERDSFPALVDELRQRNMARQNLKLVEMIDRSIKTDRPMQVYQKINSFISDIETKYGGDDANIPPTIFNLREQATEILTEYRERVKNKDNDQGVKVGLSVLDEATHGYKPQTLNIVVGEVGKGKSTILLNWAAEAFKGGRNVIFFALEMPVWQVKARFVARTLWITYDDFLHGTLSDDETAILEKRFDAMGGDETFDKIAGGGSNYFIIIDKPDMTADIKFVENMIKKQEVYGKPDAIFVDYLGNMRDRDLPKSAEYWQHSGECAIQLRSLAKKRNMVVFTAQQINKEGLKTSRKVQEEDASQYQVHSEYVAADKRIVDYADSIIGFTPEPDKCLMHFHMVKHRDAFYQPFSAMYVPSYCYVSDWKTGQEKAALGSPKMGEVLGGYSKSVASLGGTSDDHWLGGDSAPQDPPQDVGDSSFDDVAINSLEFEK